MSHVHGRGVWTDLRVILFQQVKPEVSAGADQPVSTDDLGAPDAKDARDEARVKARRGEYIDRNTITVAEYLAEWIDSSRRSSSTPAVIASGPSST